MIQLIVGAAIGAAAMYLLDPQQGRSRQALARDKLKKVSNEAEETAQRAAKQASDRAHGLQAEAQAAATEGPVPNDVLAERVRAAMGRKVSHPGAVVVSAEDGDVTLSGKILRNEEQDLIKVTKSVRGVKSVTNRLEVHDTPGNVPDLQG